MKYFYVVSIEGSVINNDIVINKTICCAKNSDDIIMDFLLNKRLGFILNIIEVQKEIFDKAKEL